MTNFFISGLFFYLTTNISGAILDNMIEADDDRKEDMFNAFVVSCTGLSAFYFILPFVLLVRGLIWIFS